MHRASVALWIWAFATSAVAEAPFLTWPLQCIPGVECYIEDYVDADPADGAQRDYTCGIKSRDGHRGTDFALTDMRIYARGVPVVAAAPGVVSATRDGVTDQLYTDDTAHLVDGRECGNAVRIEHENGLQTLYCHLRKDSVRVSKGEEVARGAPLGLVGLSGQTNYPHVHMSVLGPDGQIDPFDPDAAATGTCGAATSNLWIDPQVYTPTGMFTAGFSDRVPTFDDVRSGAARVQRATPDSAMVLYAHVYYALDGDQIRFHAIGPTGETFDRTVTLDAPKASQFRAFGRKAPAAGWPGGTYQGTAQLIRDGKILAARFTTLSVRASR